MAKRGPVQLKVDFMLHIASGQGIDVEEIIGEHPDALQWTDVGDGTALRFAVAHGSAKIDLVRLLIDRGSDVNWQDKDGLSPLMFTAMHGDREVMRLLLAKGANEELTDNKGRTAAQIAYDCDRTETALELVAYAQNKRDAAERQRRAAIDAEAAEAHKGLDRTVLVKKPLVMRPRP